MQRASVTKIAILCYVAVIYFLFITVRDVDAYLYCKLVTTENSYTDYNFTSHTLVFDIDVLHIVNHSPPLMT